MKYLLLFLFSLTAYAGTCTSISRTNAASLSVLTSSKYNTDINTAYTAVNAFDAGCITSGTLESDALNTSQFAPLLKGIKEGCRVTYSNASTVSIGSCLASVNGNFIEKTSTTSAAFGCAGCSAEVASTTYYLYIQTGSSGTTINPLISTTAPNENGYDGSGNKVLARFYNNSASDIDRYSIDQWIGNNFESQETGIITETGLTSTGFGTTTNMTIYWQREGRYLVAYGVFTTGTVTASTATLDLPSGLEIDLDIVPSGNRSFLGWYNRLATETFAASSRGMVFSDDSDLNSLFFALSASGGDLTKAAGNGIIASSTGLMLNFRVPIEGWLQ